MWHRWAVPAPAVIPGDLPPEPSFPDAAERRSRGPIRTRLTARCRLGPRGFAFGEPAVDGAVDRNVDRDAVPTPAVLPPLSATRPLPQVGGSRSRPAADAVQPRSPSSPFTTPLLLTPRQFVDRSPARCPSIPRQSDLGCQWERCHDCRSRSRSMPEPRPPPLPGGDNRSERCYTRCAPPSPGAKPCAISIDAVADSR